MTRLTSREQIIAHKEKRRLRNLNRLVDRLGFKCKKSKRSLTIVEQAIEKCAKTGDIDRIVQAIRNAN